MFERELAAAGDPGKARIVSADRVDDRFGRVLRRLFPNPLVEVSGSADVDVSPRQQGERLTIHLVNAAGPPIGPLRVAIRLPRPPKSVILEPEGKRLAVSWSEGRATLTVPRLDLYSILVVEE